MSLIVRLDFVDVTDAHKLGITLTLADLNGMSAGTRAVWLAFKAALNERRLKPKTASVDGWSAENIARWAEENNG